MLAIDVSRSMTAQDVRPTRARRRAHRRGRVPREGAEGVQHRRARLRHAARSSPSRRRPTACSRTTRSSRSRRARAPRSATPSRSPCGSASGSARSDGTVPPTSVLMISDGARDGGRTSPARRGTQRARAQDIPVSTVLVGTGAGIVTNKLVGGYEEQIRVPPSPGTLQQIAKLSGGQFFRAPNDGRARPTCTRSCRRASGTRRRAGRSPTSSGSARPCSCSRAARSPRSGSGGSSVRRALVLLAALGVLRDRRGTRRRDERVPRASGVRARRRPVGRRDRAGPRRVPARLPAAVHRRGPRRRADEPRHRGRLRRHARQPGQPGDHDLARGRLPRPRRARRRRRDVPPAHRLRAGVRRRPPHPDRVPPVPARQADDSPRRQLQRAGRRNDDARSRAAPGTSSS